MQAQNAYISPPAGDYFNSNSNDEEIANSPITAFYDVDHSLNTASASPFRIQQTLDNDKERIERGLRILERDPSTAQMAALYRQCIPLLVKAGICYQEAESLHGQRASKAPYDEGTKLCREAGQLILQARSIFNSLHLTYPAPRHRRPPIDLQRKPEVIEVKLPKELSIFVPGIQNLLDEVNFLSTYHPVETAEQGLAIAAGSLLGKALTSKAILSTGKIIAQKLASGVKFTGEITPISSEALSGTPLDEVNVLAHPSNATTIEQAIREDAVILKNNSATNILIHQKQVNAIGRRIGNETVDLRAVRNGQNLNVIYSDKPLPPSSVPRYTRIWLNDPKAIFVEKVIKAEIRRELTPIPALAKQEVMPPTAPSFTHAAPEAVPESVPASTSVKGESPSAAANEPSPSLAKEAETTIAKEDVPVKGSAQWLKEESEAAEELEQYELANQDIEAHFFSFHSAKVTLQKLLRRATNGIKPDGTPGRKADSSRFTTYQGQREAIKKAEKEFQLTGDSQIEFEIDYLGEPIGEGYLKDSSQLITTNKVRAYFENGKLKTIFPLLR